MSGKANNVAALGLSLGATAVAKKAVDATWKAASHKEPPTDPADPDVDVREALVWAVLSGAAVGVARMYIARYLARHDRREGQAEKEASR